MHDDGEQLEPPLTHPDQHGQVDKKSGIRGFIFSANKGLLAAVGTGAAGVITAAVIGAPHWIQDKLTTPTAPLTAPGHYKWQDKHSSACSFSGEYAVGPPASSNLPPSMTLVALSNWLNGSGAFDGGGTYYSFVLQGVQGKNILVTGIHTVIERRTPAGADRNPIFVISPCGDGGDHEYNLTIDLDQYNPVPDIVEIKQQETPPYDFITSPPLKRFLYLATNDNPTLINVTASTKKSDVIWHLKIDYTVDGKVDSILIPGRDQSFRTIAPLGAKKYTYLYDFDREAYLLRAGCPPEGMFRPEC